MPVVPAFPDLPLEGGASGPQPGTIEPTDPSQEPEKVAEPEDASSEPAENSETEDWLDMKVASHEHDEAAEAGLVAAAIAIWALVAIIFVAFLIMYCSEKKSRSANYTVQ